ncbi:recombination mediator RecR [Candidatus Gracilibacteria bacterium]|nr:recombination mediator RecR [Candidatus Gracilibacteria bacterium]
MPEALKRLIHNISLLPGIGENRATKLAFFMLSSNENYLKELRENILTIKENTSSCDTCFSITDAGKNICSVCNNESRNKSEICVVEEYLDLLTLEQSGGYAGVYHVLGGAISPMNGVFVGDLNFSKLFSRIEDADCKLEIIIATNPNLEGEATSTFLCEEIEKRKLKHKVKLTRLSRGLSSGYIEYADTMSLVSALRERKEV